MTSFSPEKRVIPSAPSSYGFGDFCWGILHIVQAVILPYGPRAAAGRLQIADGPSKIVRGLSITNRASSGCQEPQMSHCS